MKNIDEQAIVNFYLQKPVTLHKVAEEFDLCDVTVSRVLKRNGCRIYEKQEVFNKDFKHDYFENIDCEEKAYFLGWLISDGCVHIPEDRRQASISLSVDSDDGYILDILKSKVCCSTNVHDNRTCRTLAFRSNKMSDDLMRYGVVPNKSLITFLPSVPDEMYCHLFRGILDGDGCVRSSLNKKNGKHNHYINFSGSHRIINDIKTFLQNRLGLSDRKIYYYENYAMITWSAISDMNLLGHFLYDNSTICLKRKYEKFLDFQKHYNLV